ncbi:hypothetical protein T03_21 [Trichinella britovi]|uniref:Uncharacterized protein n=1 Tax=Trichinella britovi TaxID=45882 RepID=A0A0V1DCM0_TRIBR|nr:hypothetical protein T09_352 [Trichinella sp. T9]KRY59185.1 hypothetical protein T03_21 [Trichinella britovi]
MALLRISFSIYLFKLSANKERYSKFGFGVSSGLWQASQVKNQRRLRKLLLAVLNFCFRSFNIAFAWAGVSRMSPSKSMLDSGFFMTALAPSSLA